MIVDAAAVCFSGMDACCCHVGCELVIPFLEQSVAAFKRRRFQRVFV